MDTDHTHESVDGLADEITGHLLREPDPVLRWGAIRSLAGQLDRLRAITAKQAELEGGSVTAAAERLGVTRQYLDELYGKTDTPKRLADRDRADRPAHRYGVLLAVCREIADRAGTAAEYDKAERTASQSSAAWMAMRRSAERWLGLLRRSEHASEVHELRQRLFYAEQAAAELIGQRRHLTLAEQGDAILGYHTTRAAASR